VTHLGATINEWRTGLSPEGTVGDVGGPADRRNGSSAAVSWELRNGGL
jgi:hypothetical protein